MATLPQPTNGVIEGVRDVFEHVARLFFQDRLLEEIDSIAVDLRPKSQTATRCCIYKDRATIRYQIMACLGIAIENETDEFRTLRSYAEDALKRERAQHKGPALTVLEESCNRCMKQQYYVTDACQNCVARPCAANCPKKAIDHFSGKAHIDAEKCIRCGKCKQVCPYHAIIDLPIPCVQACPVGAIQALPDGRKNFDWNKCIYCGSCQRACPFGGVLERSQMIDVLKNIKAGKKVYAMLAPAAAGHFGNTSIWTLCQAVREIGFHDCIEVSIGADITAAEECHEFVEKFGPEHKSKIPFMTTSCCPAYVRCIRKHVPEIEEAISHTPTPMHFTARMIKEKNPDAVCVFIGPCVAKLQEAIGDAYTDFALTFVEMMALIRGKGVNLNEVPCPEGYVGGSCEGRMFPLVGGVAQAVVSFAKENGVLVKPVIIDGLNAAAIKKLKSFATKAPPGNLIEVMTCEGGCINGPGVVVAPHIAAARVKALLTKSPAHPNGNGDPNNRKYTPIIIRQGQVVDQ